MYPDWPVSENAADLPPLPHCDGPKLKPFDFKGPQEIEFLEYLGAGSHSYVVRVKILGQIYALKLFRFVDDDDWNGPPDETDPNDHETFAAFYNYSEPFSCECRAYGRLEEAGYEELSVRCFGYLLLDEKHEALLMSRFIREELEFNGTFDNPGGEQRSRWLGESGREPPIRGILKEVGTNEELTTSLARNTIRNITMLQQLGIVHLDVANRQLINGRLADFSTAVTTPHYATTPELNNDLTPEHIALLEYETFRYSCNDYWDFDEMVFEWNNDLKKKPKKQISVQAFPISRGRHMKRVLKKAPHRQHPYTFVDPRHYNWRNCSGRMKLEGAPRTHRKRLYVNPPKWYYDCDEQVAESLKTPKYRISLVYDYRDGLFFPRKFV